MFSMERSQLSGWRLAMNFYVRRIFRIYPLSVLTVLAALALRLHPVALPHSASPDSLTVCANLLLIQNLVSTQSIVPVLWSLPFELQMYLLLPALYLWIRGRRVFWWALGAWTISVFAALAQPRIPQLQLLSILLFIPNFMPGIIAYVLPHSPRVRSLFWPPFLLALVGIYTLTSSASMGWFLCLVLGASLPFFAEMQNRAVRWLSNRIATYSYGIYLSHTFCIWIALDLLAAYSLWLRVPLLIVLLVGLPVLAYHLIEKPMIGAGHRLAQAWSVPKEMAQGQEKALALPPVAAQVS
jgi:peptidoglycan/LPS O-acetylase OafA/YrhL